MANTPNLGMRKIDNKGEKFNQSLNYEQNFDKIDAAVGAPLANLTTTNKGIIGAINELNANKVAKEAGKQLSTEDYSTAEKTKLAGIPSDTAAQLADKVQNFKLKNEVVNGDFSQGTTGWTGIGTTISESSGRLSALASIVGGKVRRAISTVVGNKYYISADVEGVQNISIGLSNLAGFNLPGTGTYRVSGISTASSTTHSFQSNDSRGSGWTTYYLDNVIVIDLTSTFGAGNEPTKLEMDELLKVIPNQWWDGELSLTQKQFITWQLNLIRKNTNAIIALGGTIV